jgi:hypothetical protein
VAEEVSLRFQLIGHRDIGLGITRKITVLRRILAGRTELLDQLHVRQRRRTSSAMRSTTTQRR